MGTLWKISLLSCWAILTCVGCTPIQKAKETVQVASNRVMESTPTTTPAATQMLAVWQSELQSLPDPTQDGKQTHGLPGQIFLLTANDTAAVAAGDITIAMHDETDRPNGQPSPHKTEVYHITADILQRCMTRDERLGQCYVVFIPLNPEWKDVRKVRLSTRYDVKGQPNMSLTAKDRRLVFEKHALAQVHNSQRLNAQGAPDPNKIFAAMNAGQTVPQQQQPIGNPSQVPPSNPVMNTGYPTMPANTAPVAPSVLPGNNVNIPPQYQPIVIQRGN
jgi:hypothetical protein